VVNAAALNIRATMRCFMMLSYSFLHFPTGRCWPTDDPHQWLLDHSDDELLAPARERLLLSPDAPERCLRVAVRRCDLALVRVVTNTQIAVRHWSDPPPDLRAWAKALRLNRTGIQVTFENWKTGKVIVHQEAEDLLMFGERVGQNFPWEVYAAKYERRLAEERDDHDTAPASMTNFVWANSPQGRLRWNVLKAAWNVERVECPNCDEPVVLVTFEWRTGMLSFRSARLLRHCFRCWRRFEITEERPLAWLAKVLPPALRPTHVRLWATIPVDWTRLSLGRAEPVQSAADGG
jgi:hypothetical protein